MLENTLTSYQKGLRNLRTTLLTSVLVSFGLLAGLGSTTAANAATADADFQGTLQQVVVSLGPEAIRSLAGSDDIQEVLAVSPDSVLKAVQSGKIKAQSIEKSTVEIQGNKARIQPEGKSSYTIVDGAERSVNSVMPENRTIVTMNAAKMSAAAAAAGETAEPAKQKAERIGTSTIRGFDTTGYRFDFFGDNVATVWLSEKLAESVGPALDTWLNANPFLGALDIPAGTPVRVVVVNRESLTKKSSFLPAYTITEFYDLQPGVVDDERVGLPAGYKRQSFADMISGGAS